MDDEHPSPPPDDDPPTQRSPDAIKPTAPPSTGPSPTRRRPPDTPLPSPPSTDRTEGLLQRSLAGDEDAARLLFEAQRDRLLDEALRHRLMRYLRRFTTAEDVVNEVFMRAWSSGALKRWKSRGPGSLGRLLSRILDFVLLDSCRRHGASKRDAGTPTSDDEPPELLPSDWTTPTASARASELIELCRRVLTPREWLVWSLTEIEGLDSTTVGTRLDLAASSVRAILMRCRAKLVRALGERP